MNMNRSTSWYGKTAIVLYTVTLPGLHLVTSIYVLHDITVARTYAPCVAFTTGKFIIDAWPWNYNIWNIFKVYGLELENRLSHYKNYCSKMFLQKYYGSMNTRGSHMTQSIKIPSCANIFLLFYHNDLFPTSLLIL